MSDRDLGDIGSVFDPFGDLEDDGSEAAYGDLSRSYDDGYDDEEDEDDEDG